MNNPHTRRRAFERAALTLLAGLALLLPACTSDGQICVLGYTSRPTYDPNIRTVRVPIFKNQTYKRGIEFDVTEAVIREIESKTPFKVVMADAPADTELLGNIVTYNKAITNINQIGLVRAAETTIGVELVWRDLRPTSPTGDVFTPLGEPVVTPTAPEPRPVLVQSIGSYRPELGESNTTSDQEAVNRMAVQIISMMEHPW